MTYERFSETIKELTEARQKAFDAAIIAFHKGEEEAVKAYNAWRAETDKKEVAENLKKTEKPVAEK